MFGLRTFPRWVLASRSRSTIRRLRAPLTGQVLFVSSEANIQKNTLQVKVAIDCAGGRLQAGDARRRDFLGSQTAESVAEVSEELRLYVPQQLVQRDESGAYVWVADQSAGVARKAPVTTGTWAAAGWSR